MRGSCSVLARGCMLALVLALLFPAQVAAGDQAPQKRRVAELQGALDPEERGWPEEVGKRTHSSKTYARPDGSHVAIVEPRPIHFRDERGNWADIRPEFIVGDTPGRFRSAATSVPVSIGRPDGRHAPVELEGDGWEVTIDLLGADEQTALVAGKRAAFNSVMNHTDLVYESVNEGLKENLVLHSSDAPDTFRFLMSHEGLELRQVPGRDSWSLYRPGETERTLDVGGLCVWDDSKDELGDPEYCDEATMRVEAVGDEEAIVTYTVPREWLDAEERVFPVTIDPSLTMYRDIDTYVSQYYANTNYNSSTMLVSGYNGGRHRSLVYFDLRGVVPEWAKVNSNTYFKVYQYYRTTSSTKYARAGVVNQAWGYSTTWNNQPSFSYLGQVPVTATYQWLTYGCGATVQNWLDDYTTNHGFALYSANEYSTYENRRFYSGEYGTSAYRPRLEINYTTAPDIPVGVGGSTTALEWHRETDRDDDGVADAPNDAPREGRGQATFTWSPAERAVGYRIVMWDGAAYRQVGKVYGRDNTSWSTAGLGLYPPDSEIEGWGPDDTYAGDGWYRAATPDDPTLLRTVSMPDDWEGAGVTVTDGTYLYVRGWYTYDGPTQWLKVGTGLNGTVSGQSYGYAGPDFDGDAVLSAFYQDGFIYNGRAESPTSVLGVATSASDESTTTRTFEFDEPLLRRSTNAPITTSDLASYAHDILLTSDDEYIYSVGYRTSSSSYDGYKVRVYDRDGNHLADHSIPCDSRHINGVFTDGGSLYLVQWTGSNAAHIVKVRLSDFEIANEWTIDQGATRAVSGCFDAFNDMFWMGSLDDGTIRGYAGPGLDLKDDPEPMYEKTLGTTYNDNMNYWFRVYAFNELGEESGSYSAAWMPTLDNRTAAVTDDPRHANHEIGDMLLHSAQAELDTGSLELDITDLSISSWGPEAALSRHYSSEETRSSLFAPGWRFNFESCIETDTTTYVDEGGERHRFTREEPQAGYQAPNGYYARLTTSTSEPYRLDFKDRSHRVFDADGVLLRMVDKNGNTVEYDRETPGHILIEAANGQVIDVSLSSGGVVTGAVYATSAGTRTVSYCGGAGYIGAEATASALYYEGTEDEHELTYAYGTSGGADDRMIELALPGFEWSPVSGKAYWSFDYDAQGRFDEWQLEDSGSVYPTAASTIAYSGTQATLDLDGSALQRYLWNPTGTLAEYTNPYGGSTVETWTYDYSPTNEAVYERSPMGKEVSRELDSRGNTLYEWDEEYHRTRYVYDEHDQLEREIDPRGGTRCYSHGESGNVVVEEQVLSEAGEKSRVEFSYDTRGLTTKERKKLTETEWAETRFADFADSGEPQTTTHLDVALHKGQADPPDIVEVRSYDDFGDLVWEKNGAGEWVVKENTYTVSGRMASSEVNTGTVTHYRYNKLGGSWETSTTSGSDVADWVLEPRDARGNVTGRVRRDSSGAEAGMACVYLDERGLVERTDDLASGWEDFEYDSAGRQVKHWAPGSNIYSDTDSTRTTYDADGHPVTVIDPGNNASKATTTTYAANGLVTRVESPDGTWTEYAYDEAGNQTSETKPTDDGEATSRIAYDLAGRAVSLTDEMGASTRQSYDLDGRQVFTGLDDQQDSGTVYNALGWVLSVTDADGIETTKTYDPAGRIIRDSVAGKATTFHYDGNGRLETETDAEGRAKHSDFDAFGRTTREWHVVDGTTVKDTQHHYDPLGRLAETSQTVGALRSQVTYNAGSDKPSSQTLAYADSTSRVAFASSTGLEASRDATTSAGSLSRTVSARDSQQRPLSWSFGAGRDVSVAYDAVGKLTSQNGLGWGSGGADYVYDAESGRKTSESLSLAFGDTSWTSSYGYSDAGRLATATVDGSTTAYGFDLAGNITTVTPAGAGQVVFSYDEANRLLDRRVAGSVETTYTVDTGRGLRIAEGPAGDTDQVGYEYDESSRLATYTADLDGDDTDDVWATYSYDALGQRSRSVVAQGSRATTTTWTYDGLMLLSLEATSTEGTTTSSWGMTYLYDEANAPFAGVYSSSDSSESTLFFMVTTDRGDVVELLDEDGEAFVRYAYDAWGTQTLPGGHESTATASIDDTAAARIAERQVLRYAAYCFDEHSGLYYLSQRYYDPATMQFLTKDPAKDDGEQSAYQYCGGDPISMVDPSGEWGRYVHWTLTGRWLKKLVGWKYRKWLLRGNVGMDALWNPMNPTCAYGLQFHFNMRAIGKFAYNKNKVKYGPARKDSRMSFAWKRLRQAVRYWKAGGWANRYSSMYLLGQGMHSLQDTWAHGNLNPAAHQFASNRNYVDATWWKPWRVRRTKMSTLSYMGTFLKRIGYRRLF